MELPELNPIPDNIPPDERWMIVHERIIALHKELQEICIGVVQERDEATKRAILLDLRRLFQLNLAILYEYNHRVLD